MRLPRCGAQLAVVSAAARGSTPRRGVERALPGAGGARRAPARRRPGVGAGRSAAPLVCLLLGVFTLALPHPARARVGARERVEVVAGKPLEFSFVLSTRRLRTGWVTFLVTNEGRIAHNFAIDARATRLIEPGGSASLTVDLRRPGTYNYRCTVPGHSSAGMTGYLTVAGPRLAPPPGP